MQADDLDGALAEAKEADAKEEKPQGNGKAPKQSQATQLVELAADAELFHDDSYDCFARVQVNDHYEIMRIRSQMFKRWLLRQYHEASESAPSSDALSAAINTLEAQASFKGECRPVSVRVAGGDGVVYVDLGRPDWMVVEITADGWGLRNDAPAALHRPAGLKPLPEPVQDGDISLLRNYLNVDEAGWILILAWLVGAFKPTGPYPVIVGQGEQGTGKTSFCRFLRQLVDPNVSPLRTMPKNEHDLVIAASNGWVVALDNLSKTHLWLSDAICRLSTGGGFSTKTLYTDRDEQLFDAVRPVLLNGIDSIVTRHDLADRALFIQLQPIPDDERKPESDLNAEFEQDAPAILGGLFDAVAMALRNVDTVKLEKLPRMADFALWVTAAESALPWHPGQFEAVYNDNRAGAVSASVEASRLGAAILDFASDIDVWKGTPSELLELMEEQVGEKATKEKSWPKSPAAFSRQLRELASFLRRLGIDLDLDSRTANKREIVIRRSETT